MILTTFACIFVQGSRKIGQSATLWWTCCHANLNVHDAHDQDCHKKPAKNDEETWIEGVSEKYDFPNTSEICIPRNGWSLSGNQLRSWRHLLESIFMCGDTCIPCTVYYSIETLCTSHGCGIIIWLRHYLWFKFGMAMLRYVWWWCSFEIHVRKIGRSVCAFWKSFVDKELRLNAGQMILAASVLSNSLAIFRDVIYIYMYIHLYDIYLCTHRHKKLKLLCAQPVIVLQTNHSIYFEFHLKGARWCVQSTSSHEIGP